jgi:peptidoglycan/xylan/chitin deacetylase (PgdA/CDA1 family)
MPAPGTGVPVLAYHSISVATGPTSIAPGAFRMQMDVLVESGFRSMTTADFLDWHRGPGTGAAQRALITFDDGFADFATTAMPILVERGLSALVFLPTGKLGGHEDWRGAAVAPRPLLDWATVRELAEAGVEFGGHGVSHVDLTRLAPDRRRQEIDRCAMELAQRIGRSPRSFAPPYGRVNPAVLADVSRTYEVSFGTRLDRARPTCDRFDVPRIEMHYFRGRRRWRDFVQGASAYFLARRAMRAVREAVTGLAPAVEPRSIDGTRR